MNERLGNSAPNALMRIECTLRILLHEPQSARKQTAISTRFTHERRAIEFYTAGRRRLEREQKPRSVLLPLPLSPTTAKISPARRVRLTRSSTVTAP